MAQGWSAVWCCAYNSELISFTQDAEGVSATIRDRPTGTASVIRADYLLAADGAHSHIRAALGSLAVKWGTRHGRRLHGGDDERRGPACGGARGGVGEAQRRGRAQAVRSGMRELNLDSPTDFQAVAERGNRLILLAD